MKKASLFLKINEVKYIDFVCLPLDAQHVLWKGRLPSELRLSDAQFEELWSKHPCESYITLYGRRILTPRWQQAYGKDYSFSGQTAEALPIPPLLSPILTWTQEVIESRLNGILVNWYDGALNHYIGKHRDEGKGLIEQKPIVTISFGEHRVLRMRPWKGQGYLDFEMKGGAVFIIPYVTNRSFTHEVPASKRCRGRRISVTIRAFA